MQVDDPLVDPHLIAVPRFGSLAAGRFPCGDLEDFGRHTDGTLDFES